jgi:hypothetical protein
MRGGSQPGARWRFGNETNRCHLGYVSCLLAPPIYAIMVMMISLCIFFHFKTTWDAWSVLGAIVILTVGPEYDQGLSGHILQYFETNKKAGKKIDFARSRTGDLMRVKHL